MVSDSLVQAEVFENSFPLKKLTPRAVSSMFLNAIPQNTKHIPTIDNVTSYRLYVCKNGL